MLKRVLLCLWTVGVGFAVLGAAPGPELPRLRQKRVNPEIQTRINSTLNAEQNKRRSTFWNSLLGRGQAHEYSPEVQASIERKFAVAVRNASSAFKGMSDASIYKLIEAIEDEKARPAWTFPHLFQTMPHPLMIRKTEKGIAIDQGSLGKGQFKEARDLILYDALVRTAAISLRQDAVEAGKSDFEIEKQVLSEIMRLPVDQQRGFVKTHDVGQEVIFQRIYQADAWSYFNIAYRRKPPVQVPPTVVIKFIDDASAAVEQLHKMGWVHGDIKPLNILVREVSARSGAGPNFELEAGLADFGNAFQPDMFIGKSKQGKDLERLCGGSYVYLAPDYVEQCWITKAPYWQGKNLREKTEYAQRLDVFALATTAFEIHASSPSPWGYGCYGVTPKDVPQPKELECALKQISIYQESVAQSLNYDPFALLISRAIEPKDTDRMSSHQFHFGTHHLLEYLSKVQKVTQGISLGDFEKLYPEQSGIKLEPEPVQKGASTYVVKLTYTDWAGRHSSKVLRDLDPRDVDMIHREIQLLRDMGVIPP